VAVDSIACHRKAKSLFVFAGGEKWLHSGIGYRAPDEFLREYYSLNHQEVA